MSTARYFGEPVAVRFDQIPRSNVRWLWPGRVPLGKLTLISGDPGLGKSFLTLEMIARTTSASGWPDGHPCVIRRRCDDAPTFDDPADGTMGERDEPVGGDCVLLSAEDDPSDTIRPRLEAMGADLRRVVFVQGVSFPSPRGGHGACGALRLDRDIDAVDAAIMHRPRPRLVVIDPISAYMGAVDNNSNAEVRSVLMRLARVAAERGVAVVCVTHHNKGGSGSKAVYRAMGSLAFTAAARTAWAVVKDPFDPKRRLFLPVKNNISPDTTGLAYRLSDGAIRWEPGEVRVTADELEKAPPEEGVSPGEIEDALGWLRERLSAGPSPANAVIEDAQANMIGERTLRRVKVELGVMSKRITDPYGVPLWQWVLPGGKAPKA